MAKRLFEQGALSTISDLTQRLAFGKAGEAAQNITFQNFVTWLNSVLGFLKTSENLNDLPNKTTARTNLDVYDTTTIDAALDLKADKTNVLEKNNTTSFIPSSDYHPATKKYVDDGGNTISPSGVSPVSGDINTGASTMSAAKSNVWIHITGRLRLDNTVAENTLLYTLPLSYPLFTRTFYFSAGDGGAGDDNIELKALSGTRNIVAGEQTSQDATCSYNEAFLNI